MYPGRHVVSSAQLVCRSCAAVCCFFGLPHQASHLHQSSRPPSRGLPFCSASGESSIVIWSSDHEDTPRSKLPSWEYTPRWTCHTTAPHLCLDWLQTLQRHHRQPCSTASPSMPWPSSAFSSRSSTCPPTTTSPLAGMTPKLDGTLGKAMDPGGRGDHASVPLLVTKGRATLAGDVPHRLATSSMQVRWNPELPHAA